MKLSFTALVVLAVACTVPKIGMRSYQSDTLEIKPLAKDVFVHVSYLDIPDYGRFPCNGLIVKGQNKVTVLDTPVGVDVSKELIDWVQNELGAKVEAVVVNHFHNDCLSGLEAFHESGATSYANFKTIKFARADSVAVLPQQGFEEILELQIGKTKIINAFLGEAHTRDNIVSYVPRAKVLFGGCMIKELNAGKGNLADANLEEWSNTVRRVGATFPKAEHIIPGHGKSGDRSLLDYTISMFEAGKND